jgi:hypothetical protein
MALRLLQRSFSTSISALSRRSGHYGLGELFVQPGKLLLALASTVVLGFGPQRDPYRYFFYLSGILRVLKQGLLFDERSGLITMITTPSAGSRSVGLLLRVYSLPQKGVYRADTYQRPPLIVPLFRLSAVMSHLMVYLRTPSLADTIGLQAEHSGRAV